MCIRDRKRTVQVVAETVIHLVWRTVERKPKVTALLKTLQGELVEVVVQLAQSFHLGSSRMKHHLKVVEDIKENWITLILNNKFHALLATDSIPEAIAYYRL